MFVFRQIKKRTKRRPYIRSAYLNKQKVFLDYFWKHLFKKNPKERVKRLRFFGAAVELIKSSRNDPFSRQNPNKKNEMMHRFLGVTR